MDLTLIAPLALAWLRLQLQPWKTSAADGALAWRRDLGVKHDGYGYQLAVRRFNSSRYVLQRIRSDGVTIDLCGTVHMKRAIRAAQMLLREYGTVATLASEHNMRTFADLAIYTGLISRCSDVIAGGRRRGSARLQPAPTDTSTASTPSSLSTA